MISKLNKKFIVVYYLIISILVGLGIFTSQNIKITGNKMILVSTLLLWFIIIPVCLIGIKLLLNKIIYRKLNKKDYDIEKNNSTKIIFIIDITILLIIRIILKLI